MKSGTDALQESIEHWERLRACTSLLAVLEEGLSTRTCALCKVYYDDACEGCPVAIYSGAIACENTPFTPASIYERECINLEIDFDKTEWQKLAKDELSFLESLKKIASKALTEVKP